MFFQCSDWTKYVLTNTFLCKNFTTTQSVEECMELLSLLSQYPPSQDHRMSHFCPLRKSLCIIKMLPGNTPTVHIFYSASMIMWPCQISVSRSDKGAASCQLLDENYSVLRQQDIIVSLINPKIKWLWFCTRFSDLDVLHLQVCCMFEDDMIQLLWALHVQYQGKKCFNLIKTASYFYKNRCSVFTEADQKNVTQQDLRWLSVIYCKFMYEVTFMNWWSIRFSLITLFITSKENELIMC